MAKRRGRGAPPKFTSQQVAKIRKAYGTPSGRGRRSSTGVTLGQLAEKYETSVQTIRAVIHATGAYAVRPSAPGDRAARSSARDGAPSQPL